MIIPETYFTVHEELMLLLYSVIFGAAAGVLYDLFRTLRAALPHNNVLVAIEDIAFWVICSFSVVAFTSVMARGEFRFYYIIGGITGFALYFFTIGRVVIKIVRRLIKIIYLPLRIILAPLKALYALICEKVIVKFVGISKNALKRCENLKIPLIDRGRMLYNKKTNIKRKNVKCVGKKVKHKEQKKSSG
ncbi:MAG: spore cortex biosynthesis protein YabQ [Ruminococcus sp.]|nr:spore cortex biosynthesis protein YabQ [Ruminococcus sp.]